MREEFTHYYKYTLEIPHTPTNTQKEVSVLDSILTSRPIE